MEGRRVRVGVDFRRSARRFGRRINKQPHRDVHASNSQEVFCLRVRGGFRDCHEGPRRYGRLQRIRADTCRGSLAKPPRRGARCALPSGFPAQPRRAPGGGRRGSAAAPARKEKPQHHGILPLAMMRSSSGSRRRRRRDRDGIGPTRRQERFLTSAPPKVPTSTSPEAGIGGGADATSKAETSDDGAADMRRCF